jgi:hypothetical protein
MVWQLIARRRCPHDQHPGPVEVDPQDRYDAGQTGNWALQSIECARFEKGMHDVTRFRNRLQNGNMFRMLYIARKLIWLKQRHEGRANNSLCQGRAE